MKILSFGEVLFDVYPENEYIGGAPFNFAAHCAKHGADGYFLSCVGEDELGDRAVKSAEELGIKTDFISVSKEKETGKCLVTLDENKIPSYNLLSGVAYDEIPLPEALGASFDILYFGTLSLRSGYNLETVERILKSFSFTDVFVDMNIRPPFYSEETMMFAAKCASIIKISDEELATVLQNTGLEITSDLTLTAKALSEKFPNLKIIIITRGEKGAFAYLCKENKAHFCDAVKTKVVSTVGAGDSFSAAFLCEYFATGDIEKALAHASKVSAFVVSQSEAIPKYNPQNL